MKKVLLSANSSWYIYNFRKNLIKEIIKNYEVIVCAPKDRFSNEIELLGAKYVELDFKPKSRNIFSEILVIIRFFIVYLKIRPDIVLQFTPKNNIYGSVVSWFLGIKCLNNIAGLGRVFSEISLTSKFVKLLYKISHSHVSHIYFQNSRDQKLFHEMNIGIGNSNLLPGSGVDLDLFYPKNFFPKNKVFLLLARLIPEKGIFEYVEAARNILQNNPEITFNLIGFIDDSKNNPLKNELIDKWHEEGLINYLGEKDNVSKYIDESSCIVLPSYYAEGTPKSLLEAIASGKPIITTDNVGCADVVQEEKNGYLCEMRSSQSLIKAMKKLISLSNDELLQMGQNSRDLAKEKYDEKIIIGQYLKQIQEIT